MRSEAEIREKLESLRKQYVESDKNPIVHTKDYGTVEYFKELGTREEQIRIEAQIRDEIAILEWALKDQSHWRTSWMGKWGGDGDKRLRAHKQEAAEDGK